MKPNRSRLTTVLPLLLIPALAGIAHAQVTPDPADPEAEVPDTEAEAEVEAEAEAEATTTVALMPEVPAEAPPAPEPTSGYDKGFFIKSDTDKGTFAIKINARVQTLATFDSAKGDDERTNLAQFQIRRARLSLEGHAFTKKLGYKFQTDFGRGFLTLKDFYVDAEIGDELWVRAGQWKRPFSRQEINSSGRLELVDRAITDAEFALTGRDIGVALHNNYEKSPDTEWAVGVFNGTGEAAKFSGEADADGEVTGSFSNVPKKFLPVVVGRFGINQGGIKGYSEADLEGGGLRWAAAASVWIEADFDDNGFTRRQAQGDFILKNDGLSASAAVFFARVNGPMDALDVNTLGAQVQVGKMIDKMQPAVRYALIKDLDNSANPDTAAMAHEITGGFGWYPYGHDAKLQFDVGSRFGDGGSPADRLIARLQLSTGF